MADRIQYPVLKIIECCPKPVQQFWQLKRPVTSQRISSQTLKRQQKTKISVILWNTAAEKQNKCRFMVILKKCFAKMSKCRFRHFWYFEQEKQLCRPIRKNQRATSVETAKP